MIDALAAAGRQGRLLLVAGLIVGLFAPTLSVFMRPYVGELIAIVLFLACLRIGPRQAVGAAADLRLGLGVTLILQLLLPLALVLLLRLFGWTGPTALALTLMAAAAPISGTPALVAMLGSDPAPALRQLVLGTALLPFTALIVFLAAPGFGDTDTLFLAAGRLLLLIGVAATLAFAIRLTLLKQVEPRARAAIDGLSAIGLAAVVVGLMSAVGETWPHDPQAVIAAAALAFAASFGLQVVATLVAVRAGLTALVAAVGVSAGNRNIALFIAALPAAATDPALLFIGCYQVPMYLTPLALGGWYRWISSRAG